MGEGAAGEGEGEGDGGVVAERTEQPEVRKAALVAVEIKLHPGPLHV